MDICHIYSSKHVSNEYVLIQIILLRKRDMDLLRRQQLPIFRGMNQRMSECHFFFDVHVTKALILLIQSLCFDREI